MKFIMNLAVCWKINEIERIGRWDGDGEMFKFKGWKRLNWVYEWVKNRIMGRSNRKGEYMLKFANINGELMLEGC